MRKVLIDAHTHTVASGHAYSSLQEMAKAAVDMGLEVLGITEHGPSVPGTCPTLYFKNMFTVPRQMYGIRLLMGCEINILDTKGSLDLTDEQIGWLDLAIAGIHAAWYQGGTKEENTEGMIRVIKNPKIHIIPKFRSLLIWLFKKSFYRAHAQQIVCFGFIDSLSSAIWA